MMNLMKMVFFLVMLCFVWQLSEENVIISHPHHDEPKTLRPFAELSEDAQKMMLDLEKWNFVPLSFFSLRQQIIFPKISIDDSSILRFVSIWVPLSDRQYKCKNLVSIAGGNMNQAWRSSSICAEVKPFLDSLAKDFSLYFKEPIIAVSAYRSVQYQQRLWDLGRCNDGAFCAKPGESEHQLGLALDFFDASSELEYVRNPRYKAYYEWMKENAYRHGWTQSYKHGPKIDGYEVEPWHWRFVGVEVAHFLHTMDISYTRYLQITKFLGSI